MKQVKLTSELIQACEAAVREGRVPEAKRMLEEVNTARVKREHRLPLANLCRRIGLNSIGLKLISAAVAKDPSLQERAEHALLLQRVGNLEESLSRLEAIPAEAVPETLLYRSFCHFNRWEYHLALPLLQNYTKSEISPYARLVGKVNLAAALTATALYGDALDLLTQNIEEARGGGYRRLEGNCYEIRAQIQILQSDYARARASLEQAAALLRGEGTFNENAVIKWRAAIEAMESKSTAPLVAFRSRAISTRDWEALRHTDLHVLRVQFERELFDEHLFGTPWVGYREHAQRLLGRVIQSDQFLFGKAGDPVVNLITGEVAGAEPLPYGGALHCTLEALARDFYRPIPVGGLFSILFAGQHFDPYSSPNRVHQTVFRLRTWLAESGLPLTIELENDCYKLQRTGAVALLVPYERRTPDLNQALLKTVREKLPDGFSFKEGTERLQVSSSALREFCDWAVENGHLEKAGAGRATAYVHIRSRRAG